VLLRPFGGVVVVGSLVGAVLAGLPHPGLVIGAFGVGLAGFLALTTLLRCPACLTPLEVPETFAPLLPKKVRCPRCDMQSPSS
jgi:hypothetical protein